MKTNTLFQPRVIFLPVKETALKLHKIAQTARYHFEKKERFLIITPDDAALEFVDALLWRLPEEGFLPHTISHSPCNDFIVITTQKNNINQASALFNLCPTPLFLDEPVKLLYEFEDLTSQDKKELSLKRYGAYREAGFAISSN